MLKHRAVVWTCFVSTGPENPKGCQAASQEVEGCGLPAVCPRDSQASKSLVHVLHLSQVHVQSVRAVVSLCRNTVKLFEREGRTNIS